MNWRQWRSYGSCCCRLRRTTAKELSTVQPSGWLVGVRLWNLIATSVCRPWGVSFGIPQMFLAPCQHKYGERAGESEVPEKLCKSLYHSSPEKPQRTVVSFIVGGTQTAAHDATCWWLLVLQPSTSVPLQGVCRALKSLIKSWDKLSVEPQKPSKASKRIPLRKHKT